MSAQRPAPPGWYPQGDSLRYWDGAAWTEHIAPQPDEPRRSDLVIPGYILAVIFPIIGVILGGVALSKNEGSTRKHGRWIIGLSVAFFVIETAITIYAYQ